MYEDELTIQADRPMQVEPDERIGLMQAFVQLDTERDDLGKRRAMIEEDLKRVSEKRSEVLARLSDVLGITGTSANRRAF